MKTINPDDIAIKEFIALNKKFCEFLLNMNKMIENKKVFDIYEQVGFVQSYTSSMESLKKSLPNKEIVKNSKFFAELSQQQLDLNFLMKKSRDLLYVEVEASKKVTQFLIKQASEKIDNESPYSKSGAISHSSNHLQHFAVSSMV